MSLTKTDLGSIDRIVSKRVSESESGTNKKLGNKIDGIDKKFDKLFNFLDRDHSKLTKRVKRVEEELRIPAPEF